MLFGDLCDLADKHSMKVLYTMPQESTVTVDMMIYKKAREKKFNNYNVIEETGVHHTATGCESDSDWL